MNLTARINALGTKNKEGADNKGTLSVYGLTSRFPVSFYANQWLELAKAMPAIVAMCEQGLKDGTMAGPQEKAVSPTNGRDSLAAFTVAKK